MILSALASSPSLSKITQFSCERNMSWFSEGKESNCELLCQAIRGMKSLTHLNLECIELSSEKCEQVVSAIVAQSQIPNSRLTHIDLRYAGGYNNENFSASAKQHIADLKAKGIEIKE
mgnify:CR=1 FL=1